MRSKLLPKFIDTLPRPSTQTHLPRPPPSQCARSTTTLCSSLPSPSHRTFTTTPTLHKKSSKQDPNRSLLTPNPPPKTSRASAFDFTDYEAAIARAHDHLKSTLATIKPGGLNPASVEKARVQLVKGAKDATVVKVGDVASVVVRGRNVAVLVGEKDHIKPILSTLRSPPQNLNPITDAADPLTLLIPIPATTQESRRAAQAQAGKCGEEALGAVREARGAQRKRLRGMGVGRVVGPDELRRAEREVERINGVAGGEVKRVVEGCRRGLEGG